MGETRTVKRVLEVMMKIYAKMLGEKTQDMMRKISRSSFRADEKIDMKIHKFEEMVIEIDKISLADNLKYAVSLQ